MKNLWNKIKRLFGAKEENIGIVTSVYENALVICHQVRDKRRKEDIWDFSRWEKERIIGWTVIDNFKPFKAREWRDPDMRALAEKMWDNDMMFFGTVYGFSDGGYQLDLENALKILRMGNGEWLIIE